MYEFILDMSPISSFAYINWNKLLLKKNLKYENWTLKHPKCNTLGVLSPFYVVLLFS